MAATNYSNDEHMADNKFDDFKISEEELFFFKEDNNEINKELTNELKQLKLSKDSKPLAYYSHNKLYDFCNTMVSSDDDAGTATIIIDSGTKSDVKINPYWVKVTINELQGLGKPTKVLHLDTDFSMPDLETVSDSDNDSIIFALTKSNEMSSGESDNERDTTSFSNKEMMDLIVNDKENLIIDIAMVANAEEGQKEIQTNLYNSGALCHMSPYRDHFKNNVCIPPKPITAADKHYFQAIGKGDLWIKIPNRNNATTILLKNVLHCLDMGLTLVSISKIAAAGCKIIFKSLTCKIYDIKDKVIGQINAQNRLYQVDHAATINVAMAEQAWEVITVDELHC